MEATIRRDARWSGMWQKTFTEKPGREKLKTKEANYRISAAG
ncbi:hypothetical protein [Thiorhodospira sibirica]|nr:hypothetical protein [Thiorhodospira sibirica]